MNNDLSSNSHRNPDSNDLNVIVADTQWETFEQIPYTGYGINFLNLSSNFAVNFILEYERIDIILISRRISGLDEIIRKAHKKKASVFILGEDIKYPLDAGQVSQLLERERISRSVSPDPKKIKGPVSHLRRMFMSGSERRLLKHAKKGSEDFLPEEEKEIKLPEDIPGAVPVGKSCGDGSEKELSYEGSEPEDYEKAFWGEKNEKEDLIDRRGTVMDSCKDRSHMNDTAGTRQPHLQNFIAIKQKIIVFLKAKGGVGSTLLSLFLAYHFRKLKTLLIDLNFSEGGSDLGYYLNIPKSPNMLVFIEGYNRNAMENSIVKIKENLDVLQAPPTYELSKKMDLQDIYSMVDIARKKYHLIIFDLPNQINDTCLGVLDMADLAVMVSDFTAGSIGRLVSINKRFIYDDLDKMLVLNRNRNGNGKYFISNYVEEFFKPGEVLVLDESGLLSRKTDFDGFDFSKIKEFSSLAERILERLTCE